MSFRPLSDAEIQVVAAGNENGTSGGGWRDMEYSLGPVSGTPDQWLDTARQLYPYTTVGIVHTLYDNYSNYWNNTADLFFNPFGNYQHRSP